VDSSHNATSCPSIYEIERALFEIVGLVGSFCLKFSGALCLLHHWSKGTSLRKYIANILLRTV